jgi:hypothetical protein
MCHPVSKKKNARDSIGMPLAVCAAETSGRGARESERVSGGVRSVKQWLPPYTSGDL